jgi:hypothetical protein
MRGKPPKEHLHIEVIAMHVVQVDYVGVYLVQFRKQALGGTTGMEARFAIEARLGDIEQGSHRRTEVELTGFRSGTTPSPHDPRLVARCELLAVNRGHHGTRGSMGNAIYLHVFHAGT